MIAKLSFQLINILFEAKILSCLHYFKIENKINEFKQRK